MNGLGGGAAVVAACALVCALGACGGREAGEHVPSWPVSLDLVAQFPFTDDAPRTTAIDFSAPEAAGSLLRGWSAPVTLPDGTRGVHIVGSQGVVAFEAGAAPLHLRVHVGRRADAPPASNPPMRRGPKWRRSAPVRIAVNGVPVLPRLVRETPDAIDFEIAAALQQPGRNLLAFAQQALPRPLAARVGERPRALFASLRFDADDAGPPGPAVRHDRLVLPPGSRTSFHVRVPDEARLRLVGAQDPAGGHLRVTAVADGVAGEANVFDAPLAAGTALRPLALPAGAFARLTFAAAAANEVPVVTALTLEGREPVAPAQLPAPQPIPGTNVLLYVVDTLRADRLGCYGGKAEATPNLDRLAREGVVFTRAVAQSSWTRPATASILTGLTPASHGVLTLQDRLAEDVPTLATLLARAGYDTAAFVTNANVAAQFGFGHGFATFRYLPEDPHRPGVYASADDLHREALEWLGRRRDRPFFAYLHATDVHAPYEPPGTPSGIDPIEAARVQRKLGRDPKRITPGETRELRALYDAEVTAFDAAFGRLLARLHALGRDEDTTIVLVADHGEEFADHGAFHHGHTLFDELVHVPLIVRLPGGSGGGRRVDVLARQIDVAPTLLALLGMPPVATLQGRSLLGPASADVAADEAFADTWFLRQPLTALVVGRWKIVLGGAGDDSPAAVYDLARDPAERTNVAIAHPALAGYARQRIAALYAGVGAQERSDAPLDPELAARLRALGYAMD